MARKATYRKQLTYINLVAFANKMQDCKTIWNFQYAICPFQIICQNAKSEKQAACFSVVNLNGLPHLQEIRIVQFVSNKKRQRSKEDVALRGREQRNIFEGCRICQMGRLEIVFK